MENVWEIYHMQTFFFFCDEQRWLNLVRKWQWDAKTMNDDLTWGGINLRYSGFFGAKKEGFI